MPDSMPEARDVPGADAERLGRLATLRQILDRGPHQPKLGQQSSSIAPKTCHSVVTAADDGTGGDRPR
jgi:hypothetical protein